MEDIKQVTTYVFGTNSIDMCTNKETHKWVKESSSDDIKNTLKNKRIDGIFEAHCKVTYEVAISTHVGDVFFAKAFHPLNKEGDALISLLKGEEIMFVVAKRYWTDKGIHLDLVPCFMSMEDGVIDHIRAGKDFCYL